MTEWATVIVIVSSFEVDALSGRLWDLGVSGIEEHELPDGLVELRIGCEGDVAPVVDSELAQRWPTSVESTAAEAGLDAWREHAQVWRVGALVVVPPWLVAPSDVSGDDHVLLIDPGHSFGSASHPTTRRCLALVQELVDVGQRVADIGCGSGVLSIAAARLGAAHVDATDIAPAAIEATLDNAARNGVSDLLLVSTAEVRELGGGEHDLVLANIGAATLSALASDLIGISRSDGRLVLSGILDVQVAQVRERFESAGARLEVVHEDDEWRTLVMRRWN